MALSKKATGWLVIVGALLAVVLVFLFVTGTFEEPVATAKTLREIGERVMLAADGVVYENADFDVQPWLDEIDDVDSFHKYTGFAKDELKAAIRGINRYSEVREDRDMDLAHWHYSRFLQHLFTLENPAE